MLFSPGVLCLHFVHLCPPVRFPHFSSATSEESCFISLSPSQHCFLPPLSQPDISHISHGKEKLRNGNGEIKLYQYCLKSILLLLNFSILSLLGKQRPLPIFEVFSFSSNKSRSRRPHFKGTRRHSWVDS